MQIIKDYMTELGDFPYDPPVTKFHKKPTGPNTAQWDGPMLLVKGKMSKYINPKNTLLTGAFFPHFQLEQMAANHWVQAERPAELMRAIELLIRKGHRYRDKPFWVYGKTIKEALE